MLVFLNVVRLSYGIQGYDLPKSAPPADGCVHPIFIPVYTKAERLPEQELYYNKIVQPSPASYTPSPLVSIYVASTPKPYIPESEKVYGVESAEINYAAQVVPKISYATPVTKQEYAKAIYQSTAKPSYTYSASSEKYAEELSSKYSSASSSYSSGDYAHEGKSYSHANIPIQYQFIAPAVGYVSSTPAPLKYHSLAPEASYSLSSLNKASAYDHHSYEKASQSYYPSSTPVYPSSTPIYSKSHSYIKQSPSYVSSTPAYASYPSSTPAYPTYSSTLAPYPAYEPAYIKQSPLHVVSHSAYAADEKESAEHYYAHSLNGDYGHAQVKYAGSYSKEYLPPTSAAYPVPASYNTYSGSHGAGYKGYSGQSYSNSYYNSGASSHQNAYHPSKSAANQSPKYPTPSPYQYSSQYQYSSAPLTYSPYQPAGHYSYTPAVKSYASYSPAPASHGYSGHHSSTYDASKYLSNSQYSSHNIGYAVKEASHASQYNTQGVKYVPVAVYPASSADVHTHQYSAGNAYAHQSAQYAAAQAHEAAEYAAAQAHAQQVAEYAAAQASAHQAASQYAAAAHAKQASHYAAAHQSAAHAQYSSNHASSGNKYSASYHGHSAVPSVAPEYVQYAQPAYPVAQYATAAAPLVGTQYHAPAYKSYLSSDSEHSHKYHGVQSVASQHEEYYVSIAWVIW